ncbi:MAG TPA: DUF4388 domain-containing protein [Acidimicrobiia bacterium]|nr:DUF4388 domain-containing protein [Acidimicrobiia bacterium]
MMLSGNLSNWSVADLLQMMRVTGKTAALRIEGTRAGVIHFNEGKLAGATLAGQRPPMEPDQLRRSTIDALFVLTGPTEGSFFVASPEFDPNSPSWEVTEVMAEVEHLRLIESEIRALGVEENSPLVLSADVPSPVTLHAEDWVTLVALVPAFSLASLERTMGRTRAFQVVNTLLSRGLTVKDTAFEVDLAPPPPVEKIPTPAEEFPVLEWLGDHPAEGEVDLSTDIPTRPDEEVPAEPDARRHLKGVHASAETTLVSGVLDDMRRLRTNNG